MFGRLTIEHTRMRVLMVSQRAKEIRTRVQALQHLIGLVTSKISLIRFIRDNFSKEIEDLHIILRLDPFSIPYEDERISLLWSHRLAACLSDNRLTNAVHNWMDLMEEIYHHQYMHIVDEGTMERERCISEMLKLCACVQLLCRSNYGIVINILCSDKTLSFAARRFFITILARTGFWTFGKRLLHLAPRLFQALTFLRENEHLQEHEDFDGINLISASALRLLARSLQPAPSKEKDLNETAYVSLMNIVELCVARNCSSTYGVFT